MLKKTLFGSLFLCLVLSLHAQPDCAPTAYATINANRIKAHLSNGGDLFNAEADPGFAVPFLLGAPETHTLFLSGLWLAALDPAGNLHTAIASYRSSPDNTDFRPGPLDNNSGGVIDGACQQFDRIWRTNRYDIQLLKADFSADGIVDGPIPASLRQWPARGNPYFLNEFGFPLPFQLLAPFYDQNGDGNYDPADGDHPALDGDTPDVIPDEMLWTVFNDAAGPHFYFGEPLGVEVQLLVFAFNCSDQEMLNHTVFTRHRIINRSPELLENFRLGLFTDPDIGCFLDDYIGVDSSLSTVYYYNADAVDGNEDCTCNWPVNTYCQATPVQTTTFLSQPLSSFLCFVQNLPGTGSPDFPPGYYNALSGRWVDGTPITRGGTGYNPGSTDTTLFALSGPPDDTGWTMVNGSFQAGDYRALPAIHLEAFFPGQILELDMAHTFHYDPAADFYGQVGSALASIPDLHDLYANGYATPCAQSDLCTLACVWPGDANNSGIVEPWDALSIGVAAGNSAIGPVRPLASTNWYGQGVDEWPLIFADDVNYKHADANGDGLVDALDAAVFALNFDRERPDAQLPGDLPAAFAEFDLILEHNRGQVDQNAPTPFQKIITTTVSLGTGDQPVEDIYGIAFTIQYDTALLTTSVLGFNSIYESIGSFLGAEEDIISFFRVDTTAGRIAVSLCRLDGQNVSGFGPLGRIRLQLREGAQTGNADGTAEISYQVLNLRAINAAEEVLQLGARAEVVEAINLTYAPLLSTALHRPSEILSLYPNPTTGQMILQVPETWEGKVTLELFDPNGRVVFAQTRALNGIQINTTLPENLPTGLYLVRLRDKTGRAAIGRVVLQK